MMFFMLKTALKIFGCVCFVGVGTVLQSLTGNLVVSANNYVVSRIMNKPKDTTFKADAKMGF